MSTMSKETAEGTIEETKKWLATGVLDLEQPPVWRIYKYKNPHWYGKICYKAITSKHQLEVFEAQLGGYIQELVYECKPAEQCDTCKALVSEMSLTPWECKRAHHGPRITTEDRRP